MAFSALPPEIHVEIATHCDTSDLHNLCLASKLMNERFCHALYRHVDLQHNPDDKKRRCSGPCDNCKRQQQFVYALLSHPEYGKHVRSLKTNNYIFRYDGTSFADEYTLGVEFWHSMQSLTRIQSVDIRSQFPRGAAILTPDVPNALFQSATSVRLAGFLQRDLAKLILHAIDPAKLKHLCLDLLEEYKTERRGDIEFKFLGPPSGLLTTLTGRCTALRTLILRRIGQYHKSDGEHLTSFRWQAAVALEEASYLEWTSFIRSVQGTLEEFTFELVRPEKPYHRAFTFQERGFTDNRFQRLILPTVLSGDWPCLNMMELRGVRVLNGQAENTALTMRLRAVLGGDAKIVVNNQYTDI